MELRVIDWTASGAVRLLDQTLLPQEVKYLQISSVDGMIEAIKSLRVRGAPLIGIAAAMGLAAAAAGRETGRSRVTQADLEWLREEAEKMRRARPTAVNLSWAVDRMLECAQAAFVSGRSDLAKALRHEAQTIWDEDQAMCRKIGFVGSEIIQRGATVLTHCNTGRLATGGIGTALGVIYTAHEQGKIKKVFADETRPLNQGSRLTAWELTEAGVQCTVITDSMAAALMAAGSIDVVVVGADRIAANGDVANKIGTYGLAVVAKHHGVPFYAAAPTSTFDLTLETGREIPIEERAAEEVPTAEGAGVFNPAFDVTPANLITGIITDRGLVESPSEASVSKIFPTDSYPLPA